MRSYLTKIDSKKIIYTDGVFDLFHRGHIECFKYIKHRYPQCHLIVGVVSDEDSKIYKRVPVICEDDRVEIIKNLRLVDSVIFPCPLSITEEFVKTYKINLIMHGFSDKNDIEKQVEFYEQALDMNIFEPIPYYGKSSTTDIIEKIKNN